MPIMYPEIANSILSTLYEEGLEVSDASEMPFPGDCSATLDFLMEHLPYKKNILTTLLDMAEMGWVDYEDDGEEMTWFLTKEGLQKAMNL